MNIAASLGIQVVQRTTLGVGNGVSSPRAAARTG